MEPFACLARLALLVLHSGMLAVLRLSRLSGCARTPCQFAFVYIYLSIYLSIYPRCYFGSILVQIVLPNRSGCSTPQ